MARQLEGRTALISGAGSGIGKAIALQFSKEGAELCLFDIDSSALDQTTKEILSMGGRAASEKVDISDRAAVSAAIEKVHQNFDKIDILVNNAGIAIVKPFVETSFEDFDRTIAINLSGPFTLAKHVVPLMLEHKRGRIINISSTGGKWASLNSAAYNISKHGVIGLTRCLAQELGPFAIAVNAICPGLTETEMFSRYTRDQARIMKISPEKFRERALQRVAMKRTVSPAEIANLAVYLASDKAEGMTGQSIALDGGMIFV